MRIGWIVEGSTDRAFLHGLRDRWCPGADLVELGFRGREPRARQYPRACSEARYKDCDVVIVLTDSNEAKLNDVYRQERADLGAENQHYVITGIAVRNVECWVCAAADYVASCCGCSASDLRVADPKTAFEAAMGITTFEKREAEIAELVRSYPSLRPMLQKRSFKRFYDDVVDFAQLNRCNMPNELDD